MQDKVTYDQSYAEAGIRYNIFIIIAIGKPESIAGFTTVFDSTLFIRHIKKLFYKDLVNE